MANLVEKSQGFDCELKSWLKVSDAHRLVEVPHRVFRRSRLQIKNDILTFAIYKVLARGDQQEVFLPGYSRKKYSTNNTARILNLQLPSNYPSTAPRGVLTV